MPLFSRRLALLVSLLLAGCQMTTATLSPAPLTLLDGAVTVSGPRGYCIDPQSRQQSGDTAVVLMGRCQDAASVAPAVLTVSVGPAASAGVLTGDGRALTAYVTSTEGRAALSRLGRAAGVTHGGLVVRVDGNTARGRVD